MIINIVLLVLAAAAIVLIIVLATSIKHNSARIEELREAQKENQAMTLMQQQIGQLAGRIDQQLHSLSTQFQSTTGNIGQGLTNVKEGLVKMEGVTREILDKAKNIATLEDLLRAPKFRGGLGELFLGDLLAQVLPPTHYTLQYKFRSGEKVDAAVKIGSNLVPVDAKFPLENFKKYVQEEPGRERDALRKKFGADVKKHIDDIAAKYILPDEGTYDFALMYIPAENIYYETILKDENFGEERSLFSYATQKRVIPVSPNSFYAYLEVIVLGLKGMQIEKSARDIFSSLSQLKGDLGRFRNEFQVLGSHLVNARAKYDEAEKRLDKIGGKLELMQGDMTEKLPEGGAGTKNEE
jgi:DNA recombination protein RmuC